MKYLGLVDDITQKSIFCKEELNIIAYMVMDAVDTHIYLDEYKKDSCYER